MKKNNFVIFSAKGKDSFDSTQVDRLDRQALGQFIKAPHTLDQKKFISICKNASIIGLSPRSAPKINLKLLKQLPNLKTICLPTTGTEWINLEPLRKKKISVLNVPGFSTTAGAEFTISLMLNFSRRLTSVTSAHYRGEFTGLLGSNLKGKVLGIVGFGNIGKEVAKLAKAFGMRVLYFDPYIKSTSKLGSKTNLHSLLKQSDFISLHCPLNKETQRLLNRSTMRLIKPGAYLINTARPQIINSKDILWSINQNILDGYAVDTGYLSKKEFAPFLDHNKIIAVPHISWYTQESVKSEMNLWLKSIQLALKGQLKNRVI